MAVSGILNRSGRAAAEAATREAAATHWPRQAAAGAPFRPHRALAMDPTRLAAGPSRLPGTRAVARESAGRR